MSGVERSTIPEVRTNYVPYFPPNPAKSSKPKGVLWYLEQGEQHLNNVVETSTQHTNMFIDETDKNVPDTVILTTFLAHTALLLQEQQSMCMYHSADGCIYRRQAM